MAVVSADGPPFAGVGGVQGDGPAFPRPWHDALSFKWNVPACSAIGGRSRYHRFMDALKIEKAMFAGYDWGARIANIIAAL
jgi:pimeloyl-ACP methyl ester carboxylesterase